MADGFELMVTLDSDILPSLIGKFGEAANLGLDAWSAETVQQGKSEAPVDTGGLRNSGYRISKVTNTYAEAATAFHAANPKAEASAEPPVPNLEAVVGFAAGYALPVHEGHHTASGSFVPANPFLGRASQTTAESLSRHVAHYVEALTGGA